MRLTNTLREAFIRAVMNDVPFIDYHEQEQKVATDWAVSIMPACVYATWANENLRDYIAMHYFHEWVGEFAIGGYNLPCPRELFSRMPDDVRAQLVDLARKNHEQQRKRNELEHKLKAIVYGVSSTKTLLKQLPEFDKYIPKDAQASENLPAIANVVADLMEAGWPKGNA